ncbi:MULTISPECIES: DUF1972 domain-containing protein [unclassified Sphingomonas]|jgi:glycosyltransferase involved in cell wall biosynthesis|uniref:DUF1972 domain-containing protein n=1 Tax=unclassified Sphingomonas TaxID=196159 RepID=UPI000A54329A|nr:MULTISPECIES: DUF1972 domain-containing protein [unclassified Sphingomonas]
MSAQSASSLRSESTARSSSSQIPSTLPEARVAVVGTRGVPARYGGFETLAEQLAYHVDAKSVELTLYGQRSAYTRAERSGRFAGHRRAWLPFSAGGAQSLLHDALQLFHASLARQHNCILLLGTSAAWLLPFIRLVRRRHRIVTNIDGLEWRRDKFGPLARALLKALESLAIRYSDAIIADNDALVPMVRKIYGVNPVMIAYGADQVRLQEGVGADSNGYLLAIARVEPENNAAMILKAACMEKARITFVGNWNSTEYGRSLFDEYHGTPGFVLRPPVYDQAALAVIRSGSAVYVHGHSVGGTNPSLVEAIFHSDRILAFDCVFNRATLDDEGAYFSSVEELSQLIRSPQSGLITPEARERLRERYRWSAITRQYLDVLLPDTAHG